MPGAAGDHWGGPDVDTVRNTRINNLDPGLDTQTFRVVFDNYDELYAHHAPKLTMYWLERTNAVLTEPPVPAASGFTSGFSTGFR